MTANCGDRAKRRGTVVVRDDTMPHVTTKVLCAAAVYPFAHPATVYRDGKNHRAAGTPRPTPDVPPL